MSNSTIYPYGTNGELPTSIGLINDLVTGGVDKALTAEQGKVIGNILYKEEQIDLSLLSSYSYYLGADNHYVANANARIVLMPVVQGKTYIFVGGSSATNIALIVNDATISNNKSIPYCSEYQGRETILANESKRYVIPQDCYYIVIMTKNTSGTDISPTVSVLNNAIAQLSEEVEQLSDKEFGEVRVENINDIERKTNFGIYINTDGRWVSYSSRGYVLIPLTSNVKKIVVGTITTTNAAFLNSYDFTPVANQQAPFVNGGSRFNINSGDVLEIPSDAAAFYVYLPTKTSVYDISLYVSDSTQSVFYGNEIDDVTFNDAPITLWSTADSGLPDYENKYVTWPCVVKVAPDLYYMYYNTLGTNDSQGDQYFHLSFAYSTDGFTWVKEIPSGITPPISGTNKLFNSGVFGVCVVKVQDSEYPFRMFGSKWHESWSMYKSADGVNWTKIRQYNYYYDTQMSAIVRGSQIKVYMRMRNGTGRLDRYVGVMTTDIDGNLLAPPTIFFGKYLYNAAASPLDDRREILFPSFYNVDGNEMYLKCYVVDGKNIYPKNVDFSNIITSADKTMYVAPNLVNIGDDYYIFYFVTDQPHTSSNTRVSTMKMAKVTFNAVGWYWYPQ